MSTAPQRFGFVQFDFAGSLGLSDGRYLAPDSRVLVAELIGAPPRRRRRPGRRPGTGAPGPPELSVTRVTAIRSDRPFGDEGESREWLSATTGDPELVEQEVAEAIGFLNRALHALAVAEADPYIGERSASRAEAVRLGHGAGEELADGRYSEAVEVDLETKKKRRRRRDGVGSQERMAAIFGGREQADLCETFLLRARRDLNAGRPREAALGLSTGIDALLAELEGALSDPGHTSDMADLRRRQPKLAELARQVLAGPTAPDQAAPWSGSSGQTPDEPEATLAETLALAERVLRRRRILRG